jgi:hypothetical protein
LHREKLLRALEPVGYIEEMLAGQIVRLSWRMRRADRMQNAVVEYLAAIRTPATSPALDLMRAMVAKRCGLPRDDSGIEPRHAFGKIMARDFHEEPILKRMEQYEGRIERRLQKAMAEFHRWRLMRQMAEQEKPAPKAQDTSCKTKPISGDEAEGVRCTPYETRCETKPISEGQMPGDAAETALAGAKTQELSTRGAEEPACKTKPMAAEKAGG